MINILNTQRENATFLNPLKFRIRAYPWHRLRMFGMTCETETFAGYSVYS